MAATPSEMDTQDNLRRYERNIAEEARLDPQCISAGRPTYSNLGLKGWYTPPGSRNYRLEEGSPFKVDIEVSKQFGGDDFSDMANEVWGEDPDYTVEGSIKALLTEPPSIPKKVIFGPPLLGLGLILSPIDRAVSDRVTGSKSIKKNTKREGSRLSPRFDVSLLEDDKGSRYVRISPHPWDIEEFMPDEAIKAGEYLAEERAWL